MLFGLRYGHEGICFSAKYYLLMPVKYRSVLYLLWSYVCMDAMELYVYMDAMVFWMYGCYGILIYGS